MSYSEFLRFYGLPDNKESLEAWEFNEWSHGRAYLEAGRFYSTETGAELNGKETRK